MASADHETHRLYLDFDSFFATAEQHFNPALRGQPVGVVPLDTINTGCIAVSREAKAMGVKFGATIRDARRAVPDMIFVVARPDAYVRLHHRILETIERCLPVAKVRSIDELVCNLLPTEADRGAQLADRIKQALQEDFSDVLTCSIGIARTELLAKIAAEMEKPDGVVILKDDDVPARLADLPLKDLPGVSDGIEARLNAAGVQDFAGLWAIEAKRARAIWGSVEGERFWNSLHGLPFERPTPTKSMIGHSRMLPVDWRNPDKVAECARLLLLSAARRLRRAGLRSTRLTLSIRGGGLRTSRSSTPDNRKWSKEVQFIAARDDRSLLEALSIALGSACGVDFKPRSVSVMLHGLDGEGCAQEDLFSAAPVEDGSGIDREKWERASDAMDALRAALGPDAVTLGPNTKIPGGYLGSKIAFGRIPELSDFSEAPTEDGATHFCSFSAPVPAGMIGSSL
ncbi:type VI secretion protein ImpB [Rhizobiaceae bacterium]|nr:type VI secretion protein ImpB [Rhizobiaceae bacterium]